MIYGLCYEEKGVGMSKYTYVNLCSNGVIQVKNYVGILDY